MVSPPERSWRAYRIVSRKYPAFDGAGCYRWGSRWVSPGRWVVHAAETYSLAVLENLVHWQSSILPPTLVSVEIEIPHDMEQEQLDRVDVPEQAGSNYSAFREVGDEWYDRGHTAVLWVPSVVSPYESNVLFNQRHEEFTRIVVGDPVPAPVGLSRPALPPR